MLSRVVVSQVKHNSYFLVGLVLGLWLALAAVPLDDQPTACESSDIDGVTGAAAAGVTDEFEPVREERVMGAAPGAGRSVQRPRYYTTELGMRGGLLAGALSSEEALAGRAAALNATARLSPALRLFIAAAAARDPAAPHAPHRANVVAFTDTREMLKPFHALKYLADNYLEEYDFFFLVSDTSFVNARRLSELVARLSVSQDVYMGSAADDDTHYCSLEGGMLLSNSVLRAVHGELDWCVRNSYSPRHHENIGRCVLHAAHLPCQTHLQGESYISWKLEAGEGEGEGEAEGEGGALGPLRPALADAVTVRPLADPRHFYQLHAYISRVYLERAQAAVLELRARGAAAARRHPPGYRNTTWPAGLRTDPGLAPQLPANRFDHLRWTPFNATHAFMPDDHRTVAPLSGATKMAVDMVVEEAVRWARRRWGASAGALEDGAWCWQPPHALRYRLLLRLAPPVPADAADTADTADTAGQEGIEVVEGAAEAAGAGGAWAALRQVEVARVLGAARLAPARYVTESARVHIVLPVALAAHAAPHAAAAARAALARYDAACLQRDANTALLLVLASPGNDTAGATGALANATASLLGAARALADKHRGARLDALSAPLAALPAAASRGSAAAAAARAALAASLARVPRDALVLLADPELEFNEDFLNRVRMNTIQGEQWWQPLAFARYAQFAHPRFVEADGSRPALNTGRFSRAHRHLVAFYRSDYEAALEEWRAKGGSADASAADVLAASALRALRAPEPAALLAPQPPPCPLAPLGDNATAASAEAGACLQRERDGGFARLELGARHALAKLLLETQADRAEA